MTTIEDIIRQANYIVDNQATVRKAAAVLGCSKSTIHFNVTKRLKKEEPELYKKVRIILDNNKAERHIRGGIATAKKYKMMKL